ncbi:MAG: ArsR family transcriptional regulator [Candidatus Nanohaloarchaea archaeon]
MELEKNHTILNSELAVEVMSSIAEKSNGDYGSSLAEELGKPQSSVSRVLTDLNDAGFIRKGERKRAQYYVNDYESIAEYWYQTIHSVIKEEGEGRAEYQSLEPLEDHEEELKEMSAGFFRKTLRDEDLGDMTVYELLFTHFLYSIVAQLQRNKDLLEDRTHLYCAKWGLVLMLDAGGSPELLGQAIKEAEE